MTTAQMKTLCECKTLGNYVYCAATIVKFGKENEGI